jgi:hypothetical protein
VRRTIIAGLILAVVAWVLLGTDVFASGSPSGDLTQSGMLGIAVGAALALVPYPAPALAAPPDGLFGRALAWAVGLLTAWAGYALWAAVLPDTAGGRAAGAVLVVLLLTAVAAASAGRLPFWALMLGVVSLVGAYETTFSANPTAFVGDSTTAATRVALATALAFCLVALVAHPVLPDRGDPLEYEPEDPLDVVPEPLLVGDPEVPRAREASEHVTDPAEYRSES